MSCCGNTRTTTIGVIDDAYAAESESPYFENGFVVAGDDLPRFCWALLTQYLSRDTWSPIPPLSELDIAMEISHGMDASTTEGGVCTENQGDIEAEAKNKKETTTNNKPITKDEADTKGESPKANINQNEATEDDAPADDNDASDGQNTDTKAYESSPESVTGAPSHSAQPGGYTHCVEASYCENKLVKTGFRQYRLYRAWSNGSKTI